MDILGKPRGVKRTVKVWNKEVNGDINERIDLLEKSNISKMRWVIKL